MLSSGSGSSTVTTIFYDNLNLELPEPARAALHHEVHGDHGGLPGVVLHLEDELVVNRFQVVLDVVEIDVLLNQLLVLLGNL